MSKLIKRWEEAMGNLMERRKSGSQKKKPYSPAGDYKAHLDKFYIGNTLLDVGCGGMTVKGLIPKHTKYFGLDAFPVNDEVIKGTIEHFNPTHQFDTVVLFAVLDGVFDLDKALENINKLTAVNIIILTGIEIEPDKFHTFKITFDALDKGLGGFNRTHTEELAPKVFLIEYHKK